MKSKCCEENSLIKPRIVAGSLDYIWVCSRCNQPCEVIKEEPRYMVEQTMEKDHG